MLVQYHVANHSVHTYRLDHPFRFQVLQVNASLICFRRVSYITFKLIFLVKLPPPPTPPTLQEYARLFIRSVVPEPFW